MDYIESQVLDKIQPADEELVVYKTGSHSGYLTYDGVDINGKRTSDEILEQTNALSQEGNKVTKLSIIGYSLGGLISRYAVGILYSQGYFDDIDPVNFITFCTPHVGVLHPMNHSISVRLFNNFAPYFLAHSGSQMFLKDMVSKTQKPLLVVMADVNSYFYKVLKLFKHKSLYANVVNDKRAAFFTSAITAIDPVNSMINQLADNLQMTYIKGYEPIVVDIEKPLKYEKIADSFVPANRKSQSRLTRAVGWVKVFGSIVLYTPLWVAFFISNSIVQRIRLNNRVSNFLQDASNNLHHLYDQLSDDPIQLKEEETHNTAEEEEELERATLLEKFEDLGDRIQEQQYSVVESVYSVMNNNDAAIDQEKNPESGQVSVMNLNADQKFIISLLNTLGWNKYPVVIRNSKHSHAAAIVRFHDPNFDEGKVVIDHLVNEVFQLE